MKVAVWDTYVIRNDNKIMHFDIIVPNELKDDKVIFAFGYQYLKGKHAKSKLLSSKECAFCHIEEATEKMLEDIDSKGYHIVEIENCN